MLNAAVSLCFLLDIAVSSEITGRLRAEQSLAVICDKITLFRAQNQSRRCFRDFRCHHKSLPNARLRATDLWSVSALRSRFSGAPWRGVCAWGNLLYRGWARRTHQSTTSYSVLWTSRWRTFRYDPIFSEWQMTVISEAGDVSIRRKQNRNGAGEQGEGAIWQGIVRHPQKKTRETAGKTAKTANGRTMPCSFRNEKRWLSLSEWRRIYQ